jgi:hypothetical protein
MSVVHLYSWGNGVDQSIRHNGEAAAGSCRSTVADVRDQRTAPCAAVVACPRPHKTVSREREEEWH